MIHTDLKPENVSLCLTEKEVMDIAKRGQLTSSKNYDLMTDLKKVAQDLNQSKKDNAQESEQPLNKKAEAKKRQRQKKKEKLKQAKLQA